MSVLIINEYGAANKKISAAEDKIRRTVSGTFDGGLAGFGSCGHTVELLDEHFLALLLQFFGLLAYIGLDLMSFRFDLCHGLVHGFCRAVTQFDGFLLDLGARFFSGLGREQERRAGAGQPTDQETG